MTPEEQQRMIVYYIEDAKAHLKTIEQYLVNLEDTNECLFEVRADSSAGAIGFVPAMLHISNRAIGKGIHETAAYLRSSFHSFQIFGPIKPDQKLKNLFMQVFYALKELVEQLQELSEATDAKATEIISDLKPIQKELNAHLSLLRNQSRGGSQGKGVNSSGKSGMASLGDARLAPARGIAKDNSVSQQAPEAQIEAHTIDDTSSVDDLRSLIDQLLTDSSST